MTEAQLRDYKELSPVYCIPYEHKKINYVEIFGNTNPVVIEIGFGMGTATALLIRSSRIGIKACSSPVKWAGKRWCMLKVATVRTGIVHSASSLTVVRPTTTATGRLVPTRWCTNMPICLL